MYLEHKYGFRVHEVAHFISLWPDKTSKIIDCTWDRTVDTNFSFQIPETLPAKTGSLITTFKPRSDQVKHCHRWLRRDERHRSPRRHLDLAERKAEGWAGGGFRRFACLHLFLLAASKSGEQRRQTTLPLNCALVGNPIKSMSPLNVGGGYGGAKRQQRSRLP